MGLGELRCPHAALWRAGAFTSTCKLSRPFLKDGSCLHWARLGVGHRATKSGSPGGVWALLLRPGTGGEKARQGARSPLPMRPGQHSSPGAGRQPTLWTRLSAALWVGHRRQESAADSLGDAWSSLLRADTMSTQETGLGPGTRKENIFPCRQSLQKR